MTKKIPHQLENHGTVRTDNYYWMNQREDPDVVAYLEAENRHTEEAMAHTTVLREHLYDEIKNRIKPTDCSAPYRIRDYYYYTRFEEEQEYSLFCRKPGSLDGEEQLFLNVNTLAEGHAYYQVKTTSISSGQNLVAWAVDTVGRRICDIYFKDLDSGEILADVIKQVTGSMAWANDNRTLFYARQDPDTLRSNKIFRHILGTDSAEDVLVYEEKDETFATFVSKSKSREYLYISSLHTLSTECRILNANDPTGEWKVFQPRQRNHEYQVEHFRDHFYVLTNHGARNFRLMTTPVSNTALEAWSDKIPHREDTYLEGFELFDDYLVLEERKQGLIQLQVIPSNGSPPHYLDFGEPAYDAYVGANHHFDSQWLRYAYTSLTTPSSVILYNMVTREKKLLKQEEVLGDFEKDNYKTERLWAPGHDGVEVPISLVYRRDKVLKGGNPLLLYGYGSYGMSTDAAFHSARLTLLDRGFVFAIAHVRGGQELGRAWYEDGKLLKKKNTFYDFITCGETLVERGYADPEKLFAMGGSAGGLLVGAVINERPDLFKAVVAAVPFVDVVTTMLDDSIPLTTGEYDEWGDPNQKEFFDYMLSYAPLDNVRATAYPHLLVTTGLHDSQVQYWEPAKWVAKLRELKTDNNRLLLKTDMTVGHGGASGRYKFHKDTAFNYAFLIDLADADSSAS